MSALRVQLVADATYAVVALLLATTLLVYTLWGNDSAYGIAAVFTEDD
jgi:hypothetical protein